MTQQQLEPPGVIYPQVVRVISNPIFPNEQKNVLTWSLGEDHPFIKGAKIFRMYADLDGVDIYYLIMEKDGMSPRQHRIPRELVRLVDKEMPPAVFIEELRIAEEAKLDDPEDDDDDEPDEETPPGPPPVNGQQTVS